MNFIKRFIGLIVTIISIGTILLVWFYRQDIYDWWRLRDYSPPHSVVALADRTTMTDKGRKIFYVNRPAISDASEFNTECSQETSIVLGCYAPGVGIFLYNVEDQRLVGVKEVTAAHEMLHAAYDRLSNEDRKRVDNLTQQAYAGVTNERIKKTVEKYKTVDPGVVPNELHSILATEVKELPPELEAYYKQYFKNRTAVVALSDQYESEFSNRQNQVADYDNQLAQLKIQVEASKNDLAVQYSALTSEKRRLDSLLNGGDVSTYNQNVPAFNEQVKQYNVSVKEADKLINSYNSIVEKRNSIAVEVQDLAEAIDSRPQTF